MEVSFPCDGPEVIGMKFLGLCKLSIDGPGKKGNLELDELG